MINADLFALSLNVFEKSLIDFYFDFAMHRLCGSDASVMRQLLAASHPVTSAYLRRLDGITQFKKSVSVYVTGKMSWGHITPYFIVPEIM